MISIVIPTYNEAENIARLVAYLLTCDNSDQVALIVVDGGSTDDTVKVAAAAGAQVVSSPQKGRAAQMNYGASLAKDDVLYFIHADSFPPVSFVNDIRQSIAAGFAFGRYRTKFDCNKWILKINAFFTRFDLFICYGGDQTFFIVRQLFDEIGGFNAGMQIMEDYEIIARAKAKAKYKIMQKNTLVSARKYHTNSWLAVQRANYTIVQMYKKGASQQSMAGKYKELLKYR